MNHKFINRKDDRIIYFSSMGKKVFENSKEIDDFRYAGPITSKQQAIEEEKALANLELTEEDEMEQFNSKLKKDSKAIKAKELTPEELDAITKDKTASVIEEMDEDHEANELKLDSDKKKLKKDSKDGKEKE